MTAYEAGTAAAWGLYVERGSIPVLPQFVCVGEANGIGRAIRRG